MSEAIADLLRAAAEPGTGHALPAHCYTDPEVFALEREHVLRPGWHAVARWDELPEPGDYRALDLHGEPVLLVRGDENIALLGVDRRPRTGSAALTRLATSLMRNADGEPRSLPPLEILPKHAQLVLVDTPGILLSIENDFVQLQFLIEQKLI